MIIMNILRGVLAFVIGLVVGSIVNGGLIHLGMQIIPPPAGADVLTPEGLQASIHLFEPKHFVTPFVAHAIGTLVGALIAVLIATQHRMKIGYAIGALFLVGGIYMVTLLPAPMWFNVVDLVVAYFPMAWLGGKLAVKFRP